MEDDVIEELAIAYDLTMAEAVAYFLAKDLVPTFNWFELLDEEHDIAFTVAKMLDVDLLRDVQLSLEKALDEGLTLAQWSQLIVPEMQAKGWFDELEGNIPSRLENIFRTNLQSAYAAGNWLDISQSASEMPYLMYDAIDDNRVRPDHKFYDGFVYPVDHPFWNSHYPPNGYRCRCSVIQMDAQDLENYGLSVTDDVDIPTYNWTNPETGRVEKIPFGVDPSFNKNSGKERMAEIMKAKQDKIDRLETQEQRDAAERGF